MKRTMKRTLSLGLACILLLGTLSTGSVTFAADTGYQNGDVIEFGSYPQSRVADEETLAALNAMELEWRSYDYYISMHDNYYQTVDKKQNYDPDYIMQKSTFMRFADAEYEGLRYRAVYFDTYRPTSALQFGSATLTYQDNNGFYPKNVYWFLWKPLRWIVLDKNTGLLLCQSVVDAQPFNELRYQPEGDSYYYSDKTCSFYANNYEQSTLRKWLTDPARENSFISTAFLPDELEKIEYTELDNHTGQSGSEKYIGGDTTDRVFVLTGFEASNSGNYPTGIEQYKTAMTKYQRNNSLARFNRRVYYHTFASDYAKCQGAYTITEEEIKRYGHVSYELYGASQTGRIPTSYGNGGTVESISENGTQGASAWTLDTDGIRPAIRINIELLKNKPVWEVYSGSCGDGVQWSFDEATEKLTIYGTGRMDDYTEYNPQAPWETLRAKIRSVEIGGNVQYIGAYAFKDCSALTECRISNRVTEIGPCAFWSCTQLEEIYIPDSVAELGKYAFAFCEKLNNVQIGSGIQVLRQGVFSYCQGMSMFVISDSITTTEYASLDFRHGYHPPLTIHFPASFKTSGQCLYDNTRNLTICCDSEDSEIKAYADANSIPFVLCDGHRNEELLLSGTCGENVQWAFDEESGVLSLTGTGAMDSLGAFEDYGYSVWKDDIQFVVAADGVTAIGAHAFEGCPMLEEVILGEDVTQIGEAAFKDCPRLMNVTLLSGEISANGAFPDDRMDWMLVFPEDNLQAVALAKHYGISWIPVSYKDSVLSFGGTITVHDGYAYSYLPMFVQRYGSAQKVYFNRLVFADIPADSVKQQSFTGEFFGSLTMHYVEVTLLYIREDGTQEEVTYDRMIELLQSGDYRAFKLRVSSTTQDGEEQTQEETIEQKLSEIFPFMPKRVLRLVSKAINFIVSIFKKK